MLKEKTAVFNIRPGRCFVDVVAAGLLSRTQSDSWGLSRYLLLVPNRRTVRTLRESFLRLSSGKAILLPRIQPLGDIDADEISLMMAAGSQDIADILPAISSLQRSLLLAKLIFKKDPTQSFAQAVALAGSLGHFLDEVQNEGVDFAQLEKLVPQSFAVHWQETLSFLQILTTHWPHILAERGVIDPITRRNQLLQAQYHIWQQRPPHDPVIALGFMGTSPAISDLLHLVARLPQGEVIIPGLDQSLDLRSWDCLKEDHPQYALKLLLHHLDIAREEVKEWGDSKEDFILSSRAQLFSHALRPAETTEAWRHLQEERVFTKAIQDLVRIDCDTSQEEADVIALAMREALEEKGTTAALVTPDRRLARRVAVSLKRWGIEVDDSGGQPLTEKNVGVWLMLTAQAAQENLSPISLAAMLKHPFMAGGLTPYPLHAYVRTLDRLVLRDSLSSLSGWERWIHKIENISDDSIEDKAKLVVWIHSLKDCMFPYLDLMRKAQPMPFCDLLGAHIRMAEALANTPEKTGADRLWRFEDGESAASLLTELLAAGEDIPDVHPAQYVRLLGTFLKSITVRARYGRHPRLFILGLVEARLFCADIMILGGLNEGAWPAAPAADPWMSRPMRSSFGLHTSERDIGLSAHDFVQGMMASRVIITRARKVDGTPTVPARWLLRLETVLSALNLKLNDDEAQKYKSWVGQMDKPILIKPIERPSPKPPLSIRPRRFSVTDIETWMQDPYAIYAKKILKLTPLEDLEPKIGNAERGSFIHQTLEKFVKKYPKDLPLLAAQKLLELGRQDIQHLNIPYEILAFWWPRFEKIVPLFIKQEEQRRQQFSPYRIEVKGEWKIDLPCGGFDLHARADRIDFSATESGYAIIDYKTGVVPENSDVRRGLCPQLPLEALILENGGFSEVPARPVIDLLYWRLSGAGTSPVELRSVSSSDEARIRMLIEEAKAGLFSLLEAFNSSDIPYISQPYGDVRFSDYTHLVRIREWGILGDEHDQES